MDIMTVGDLRAALEDYDDDMPVVAAHQPGWPLQETISGFALFSESISGDENYEDEDEEEGDLSEAEEIRKRVRTQIGEVHDDILYLVLGGHTYSGSPYAPSGVFDAART